MAGFFQVFIYLLNDYLWLDVAKPFWPLTRFFYKQLLNFYKQHKCGFLSPAEDHIV